MEKEKEKEKEKELDNKEDIKLVRGGAASAATNELKIRIEKFRDLCHTYEEKYDRGNILGVRKELEAQGWVFDEWGRVKVRPKG